MIIYKIEPQADGYPDTWVITAMFGNHLQWVIGTYRDRERAEHRVLQMQAVGKAAALTE